MEAASSDATAAREQAAKMLDAMERRDKKRKADIVAASLTPGEVAVVAAAKAKPDAKAKPKKSRITGKMAPPVHYIAVGGMRDQKKSALQRFPASHFYSGSPLIRPGMSSVIPPPP